MRIEDTALAELVEVLRADQQRRWEVGERAYAESFFTLHPELLSHPTIVLQMLYNEILLREANGERPQLVEYVRRFPPFADQLTPLSEVHRVTGGPANGRDLGPSSRGTKLSGNWGGAAWGMPPARLRAGGACFPP